MPADSISADLTMLRALIKRTAISSEKVKEVALVSSKTIERISKGEAVKEESFFRYINALDANPANYLSIDSSLESKRIDIPRENEHLISFKTSEKWKSKKVYLDENHLFHVEGPISDVLFDINVSPQNENNTEKIEDLVHSLDFLYKNFDGQGSNNFNSHTALERFKQRNRIDSLISELSSKYNINLYSARWVHWIKQKQNKDENDIVIGENWLRRIKAGFFISDKVNLRNVAALVDECYYPPHHDEYPEGEGTAIEGIRLRPKPDDDIPF